MAASISAPPQPHRRSRRRRSLVSLTPLIDVVFILLIFFMLATSYVEWTGIDVTAPGARTGPPSIEGAVLVQVQPDGLRLAGTATTPDELVARITERLKADAAVRIVVETARDVPLQNVVTVLDLLRGAGAADVSLVRAR